MARINWKPSIKTDRNERAELWMVDFTTDAVGNRVKTVTQITKVWVAVRSVGQSEYYQAAQVGLKPQLVFVVSSVDYSGESEVYYKGKRYSVYRSYTQGDETELYCEIQTENVP